jgi:hypothetical protein
VDDETAPFVRFFPLNEARKLSHKKRTPSRKERLYVAGCTSERCGEAEGRKSVKNRDEEEEDAEEIQRID